jgi:DNA-binding NtrC family response regulator
VTLRLPPLRDRARDIPELVRLFVEEANATYGRAVRTIPDDLMRHLETHPWPGNIRQLRNVITNAVILSEGEEISSLELGEGGGSAEEIPLERDLPTTMRRHMNELERKIIRSAIDMHRGNISRAAARLGISRKTLYEKMRRHGL